MPSGPVHAGVPDAYVIKGAEQERLQETGEVGTYLDACKQKENLWKSEDGMSVCARASETLLQRNNSSWVALRLPVTRPDSEQRATQM